MIPEFIFQKVKKESERLNGRAPENFRMPPYNSDTYVSDLVAHPYFEALVVLWHFIQAVSHHYFSHEQNAKNIDFTVVQK